MFLYQSLVLPIFDYIDYVWGCLSQQDIMTLQKMQNIALRNILNAPWHTHIEDLHTRLNIDRLDIRRKKHVATTMYEVQQQTLPPQIIVMFTKLGRVHNRDTRLNQDLTFYIPRTTLEMSKRNLRYCGVKVWENVPEYVKLAPTKKAFKRAVNTIW